MVPDVPDVPDVPEEPGRGLEPPAGRGLEPPEPMVRVLTALERLVPGQRIEILHDRRPTLLYPILDERGFEHATDEPEPGVVRIRVTRRAGAA